MKIKRLISLLMVMMLVITALSGLAVTAADEETEETYEATNPYVIYYCRTGGKFACTYPTPYKVKMTYDVVVDTPYEEFVGAIATYNTYADSEELMSVYCVDQYTGVQNKTYYERNNLEDSPFFTDDAAAKLRSIMLNGFPNVNNTDLGKAAGIDDLRICEAVHATQLAVWKTAYGEDMTIDTSLIVDDSLYLLKYNNNNEDICEEEYEYAKTADPEMLRKRVETVYNYLLNLEPTAAKNVVVSAESFGEWTRNVVANADGSYTVATTVDVTVSMTEADEMTLSMVLEDGTYASTPLSDGENECTLTLTTDSADVAEGTVTLAIDGTQTASDVFLFTPDGNRNTSQYMIALSNDQLPVHAEVSNTDRIVNIHKTDNNGTGLQNIVFDFYYVCSVEDYLSGTVSIGTVNLGDGKYFTAPNDDDIAAYVTGKTPHYTVTTNAEGNASINFGTDNDGIYIIVERENPITTGAVAPFFVAVPGGDMADDTDDYVINIQPKNTVQEEYINIEKDVTDIDNEHDTYDVGEHHIWIIQSSIPEGIGTGLEYKVTDTLDSRLTLVSVDRVAVAKDAGSSGDSEDSSYNKDEDETPAFDESEIVLENNEDYIVTTSKVETTTGEGEEAVTTTQDKFVVELTAAGMAKVAGVVGENYANHEIRIYFTAYINTTAAMNEEIPNQAHVDYTNNVGKKYEGSSDVPDVIVGAGQLLKVDASDHDKVLSDATFQVYREATTEELADESITKVEMEVPVTTVAENGTKTTEMVAKTLVLVNFYNNAAMVGDKVTEVVSDENGKCVIYGLAYGTYYLLETKAPAGYNLLPAPVEMVIDASSLTDAEVVTIYNAAGFQLPSTGGEGTTIFMVIGVIIIVAAMMIVVPKKKTA